MPAPTRLLVVDDDGAVEERVDGSGDETADCGENPEPASDIYPQTANPRA